jgi:hypothetical protein
LPLLGLILSVRDPRRMVRTLGGRARIMYNDAKYRGYLTVKALLGRN